MTTSENDPSVEAVMALLVETNETIKGITAKHKEELTPHTAIVEAAEAFLWTKLLESPAVKKFEHAGYQFKLYDFEALSVAKADWDTFAGWAYAHGETELIAKEINKTAMKQYQKQHTSEENPTGLPVGVKITVIKKSSFTKA